jgi:hypothetical protein
MPTNHLIYSSRDIKKLMTLADNNYINLFICNDGNHKSSYFLTKCQLCKMIIDDNNSGRLLFNLGIHFHLKHGIEIT